MKMSLDLGVLRRQHVRLVRQTEATECGLASLAMIANFHGLDVDIGTLRRRFQPALRGTTLKSLITMADQLDLSARAVKLPLSKLVDLHTPAILHWDMNHYVVLERVDKNKVLIHNPIGSSSWHTLEEVSPRFTGVALELRPTDNFQPMRLRERLRLSQLWRRITGVRRALLQTIVLSVVLEAYVLAAPYYMQAAIDSAAPALDYDLLTVLALGFGLFALINACAVMLRSFVLLSTGTSLGYGVIVNIARRLFRLPVVWFEKRQVGDILTRFQSVTPIQHFLTQGAVSGIIDGTLAVFVLAMMFFYSPHLTLVALTAFALYGSIRMLTFSAQRAAEEEVIIASGREQSTMIETLRGMVTLRLLSREAVRHAQWQTRLTDSTNAGVSLARIGIWQSTANTLIFGIETVVSVWLAVGSVINGGFSIGMVFAYMAYKTQFLQRASALIEQGIAFRMLSLHLERLSDIALADPDPSVVEPILPDKQLVGHLELRNIHFRYSPTDPPVLNGVDLRVSPGEHVAITGPSGGGKSTLVKILLGLVVPNQGEVFIDGKPLSHFGYRNYRDQVSAVLQDDNLFSGSLADNIALFDEAPDYEQIYVAAQAAAFHDDVLAMPMAYETLVGDMGSTLSGGQKQRLLLARALYRKPQILVMDEGTSHLDAKRDAIVNKNIAALGITRIVVAHRLETILSAHRILAVVHGHLEDVTVRYGNARAAIDKLSVL